MGVEGVLERSNNIARCFDGSILCQELEKKKQVKSDHRSKCSNLSKALMINVKAQLMERDAIFVQLLANYLKCNAIELLR